MDGVLRRLAVIIVAFATFAGLGVGAARAIGDPSITQWYWQGVPPGGFYQECAGSISNLSSYGYLPARSGYMWMKYSSGGTCNNLLTRPAWYMKVVSTSKKGSITCHTSTRYNGANTWNVLATANNCSGTPATHVLLWAEYRNPAFGNNGQANPARADFSP